MIFPKNKLSKTLKFNKGFTLIELLVVISIIGFLSSVVLASMQTAREKAITARITEDLRQVKIAAELAYGDNGNYLFSLAKPGENILANSEIYLPEEKDSFLIKKANAQATVPAACTLFRVVVGKLVDKKYIAAIPTHPLQDYSKGICYKAATSTDGTYLAVFAETPAQFIFNGSPTNKYTGFVAGNASIANLNKIRTDSNNTNISGNANTGYLRTEGDNNADIITIADISDEVIGVTRGRASSYGRLSGSTGGFNEEEDLNEEIAFRNYLNEVINAAEAFRDSGGDVVQLSWGDFDGAINSMLSDYIEAKPKPPFVTSIKFGEVGTDGDCDNSNIYFIRFEANRDLKLFKNLVDRIYCVPSPQ